PLTVKPERNDVLIRERGIRPAAIDTAADVNGEHGGGLFDNHGETAACVPNGSRLSCGRPARRRKVVGRSPCPARAPHSDSSKAITARQLQALVRRLPIYRRIRTRRYRQAK